MKTAPKFCGALLLLPLYASAQISPPQTILRQGEPGVPTIIGIGPHHRVWQTASVDEHGRTNVSSFTELATGLNFVNPATGLYEESQEAFAITADGHAVAQKGQHRVAISPALNDSNGAVDLETPDGKHLRSTILSINLHDRLTGKNLLIGELTNSVGELIAPNQVLFRKCFDTLDADVRLTYERGAFHQDVVLREAPDLAQLDALGFSLKNTRLEIWTEFLTAPTPKITRTVVESETDPVLRSQMVEPDVVEERLDFGLVDMPSGVAYLQAGQSAAPVRVLKQWLQISGRTFLVESIDVPTLGPLLASLPSQKSTVAARAKRLDRLYAYRHAPSPRLVENTTNTIQVAKMEASKQHKPDRGLIWDYVTINTSQTNYLFTGDGTYYISGNVTLSGTNTTFESGAVIKYTNNVSLTVNTPITWQGAN